MLRTESRELGNEWGVIGVTRGTTKRLYGTYGNRVSETDQYKGVNRYIEVGSWGSLETSLQKQVYSEVTSKKIFILEGGLQIERQILQRIKF